MSETIFDITNRMVCIQIAVGVVSLHSVPPASNGLLLLSVPLQLKTSLQNSEVVLAPPVKEATKLLSAYVKNVAESGREFVRWMDGTCLEMPDQRANGDTDGDQLVMHFSSEVLRMQQVSSKVGFTAQ